MVETNPLHPLYEKDTDVHAVQNKTAPVWINGLPLVGPLYFIAQVYFPTNIHELGEDDTRKLDVLAFTYHYMRRGTEYSADYRFVFVGTADYRGSKSLNQTLSTNRAKTVSDYFRTQLEDRGTVDQVKYQYYGQGKKQLFSDKIHKAMRRTKAGKIRSRKSIAQFRTVRFYSNVPVHEMEEAIAKLKRSRQKAAEQAVRGHEKGLEGAQRLVEMYDKRLLGDIYTLHGYNLGWLEHYIRRREKTRRRYIDLKEAINKGDEAFMDWMNKEGPSGLEQAKNLVKHAEKLRKMLIDELNSTPAGHRPQRKNLQDAIDAVNEVIKQLKIDLWYVERNLRWEAEREESVSASE